MELPLTTKTEFPKLFQSDRGLLQDILEICNPRRNEEEANDVHPNPKKTGFVISPEAHSSLTPPVSNLFLPPLQDTKTAKLSHSPDQRKLWGATELQITSRNVEILLSRGSQTSNMKSDKF